jgi:hypothetical protein
MTCRLNFQYCAQRRNQVISRHQEIISNADVNIQADTLMYV